MEGSVNFGVGPASAAASGGLATITFTSHGTSSTIMVPQVIRAPLDLPRVSREILDLWAVYFALAEGALWGVLPRARVADLVFAAMIASLVARMGRS
jgi:hypothetical protein